jgi:hypothetical protein
MPKKFCVVGDRSNGHVPIQRTWTETVEESEEHARKLIRDRIERGDKPLTLFVVEVVKAVGIRQPKIESVDADEYYKHYGV